MLLLRCLGQFQIEQNSQPLVLPTRKTAALLAYLALHPEVHAREGLVTLFWGDFGEEQARRSLRTALSTLRKTLGEDCVLADRETVQFHPHYSLWIDAEVLRSQTEQVLNQSSPDPSLVDLSLYRGDLLEGFYDEWILREREELRLLYLRLLLRLVQHWRTQGDYAQAVASAQRILALDPAEEAAHQHLIFCYTASNDRNAARQQYEGCVRALREALDVEPTPETVALYRCSQQSLVRTHSTAASNSNLPIPIASFIGRTHEIAKLKALLLGNPKINTHPPARLVTVTGPGGCGETRLVIQVARELLDVYADGVWWVDLAALHEDAQVGQAVAKVLDVQQGMQPSLVDVLINHLRAKQMLLILDNCEHLVAACAVLAEQLLSHCPHLQIFATSREALAIFGETSWLVPSLTLPEAQQSVPSELLQFEGIRLFVERASAVQQHFELTLANAPFVLQLCRQLDGIPLAIELAAARVKFMTVEQMATRLGGAIGARFELLTNGSRTFLPRQQTLRATMAWSYELLSEPEQHLLQQLSVFAGGWTLEAAEALGVELESQPVTSVLARLVDKSLVLAEPQGSTVRYRMLETIRQYAYEQLEKARVATARDRHLVYFLHLAEQAEPELRAGGQLAWLQRLDIEYENLLSALTWGLQSQVGSGERLLRGATLTTALIFYWKLHGNWNEGRHWLEAAAQRLDRDRQITEQGQSYQVTSLRAKALYGAGIVAWHQGKSDEAWHLLDTSVEGWRSIDDRAGLYRSQVFLGDLCFEQKDRTIAFTLWQECLDYFCQVQDRWGMAETIFYMGYAERRTDNLSVATRYYEECIALLQPIGECWLLSLAVSHLGIIALDQGHYDLARTQIEQRLMLGREFCLKNHTYTPLNYLAQIAYKQGNIRQGALLLREALTIERQAGADFLQILMSYDKLVLLALACMQDGQDTRAVRLLAARYLCLTIDLSGIWKIEHVQSEQLLAELHTRLDENTFALAWAEGSALTPLQVLEEALAEG